MALYKYAYYYYYYYYKTDEYKSGFESRERLRFIIENKYYLF